MTDPFNSFAALLPEQFGKYALLGHLATGGMAEVWLARQLGLQGFEKIVVIKRARPELADAATTQFFLDEARLVATLEHPNIAQVYEIGVVNGTYFFVMEYVDGADLRRLIERSIATSRKVTLGDALYIMTHVCTALHYAHEKRDLEGRALRLVHRDVSPSNVLISHDGAIKVCDFGIAKANNRSAEDTKSGVLKGKFSYMSPEQCQSGEIDRRSDVFSIGILLYELTTLSKLFRGASDFAVMRNIIEAPIPPPSTRVANYPPELEAIVMKALAASPAERYQTAQALQLDLEDFAREHRLPMSSVRIAKLMNSMFERRNDAWIQAQRTHSDHFIEVGSVGSDGLGLEVSPGRSAKSPGFLAIGSTPATVSGDLGVAQTAVMASRQSSPALQLPSPTATPAPVTVVALPEAPRAPRWPFVLLVGAVVAGAAAVGVTLAGQTMVSEADRAELTALTATVDRITTAFDTAAGSAHLRADGIATTPVLRAAISTDAATLSDLTTTEMMVTVNKGETLEIFQFRGDKPISLVRVPKTAPALTGLRGRQTKLISDGHELTMLASAPISGYDAKLSGGLVIATPVDFAAVEPMIAAHASAASLTGFGKPLALVGTSEPTTGAVSVPLSSRGEWNASGAALVALPRRAVAPSWVAPVRAASAGLAGLLLLGFVAGLVRRARS